jgi:hypothetical protein
MCVHWNKGVSLRTVLAADLSRQPARARLHAPRVSPLPLEAIIIGLTPIVFNPPGLVFGTALLTPLTFQEVANPSLGVLNEEILTSGFLMDTPLLGFGWTYLT